MTSLRENFNIHEMKNTIDIIKKEIDKLKKVDLFDNFKCELSIMETFAEFYNEYPFLVKQLCKNDDIKFIYSMLERLNEVEKGNISLEETEKDLGEELAEKYIYKCIKKKN
jgi:hypothetical protein